MTIDAFELISERDRMCKSFGNNCRNCPAEREDGDCAVLKLDKEAVNIIYKWSKENPCEEPHSELITGKERGKRAMLSVLDDFNALGNIYAVSPEEIRKACEVKENDK